MTTPKQKRIIEKLDPALREIAFEHIKKYNIKGVAKTQVLESVLMQQIEIRYHQSPEGKARDREIKRLHDLEK